MKVATLTLKSASAYAQGRMHETPKLDKEGHDAYEERTWRNRAHINKDGFVFIPPFAIKNCISEAAKYLSIQVPGKGKSTYTKNFEAGVLVMNPVVLPVKAEQINDLRLFVPSDGKRGGAKRVFKKFPIIQDWEGTATIYVTDETITPEVLFQVVSQAGMFIGIGSFRIRNNGIFGSFSVTKFIWDGVNQKI